MKFFTLLLLAFTCSIAFSCGRNKQKTSGDAGECKPYFQFDHVDHYYNNISDHAVLEMLNHPGSSQKDSMLNILLLGFRPQNLRDTLLLSNLPSFGFIKKEVPGKNLVLLNQIFCERTHSEITKSACLAVYRHILVFKLQNHIIGTAKICFGCRYHVIAGTTRNTEGFGQSGDYEKLEKLLT
jgi:hypothetical protein